MASVTSTGKEIMTAPQQQQRNQYQQGPSSSAASGAQQPEDELKKKNTDCVYFLASPLTCKKGSECEYRHSEYARVNPRDCFYWLNGNCLNPKCAFRHPPLDGLLGPQAAGPPGAAVPSLPPPQPVTSSAYIPAKQAVPCIFFQKGYCMKGDKCQFLHGPAYSVGKVPATAGVVSEPANFKKSFGLEKCSQQKMFQQANAAKSVEVPNLSKPSAKVASAFPVNGMLAENGGPPSNGYVVEHPEPRAPSALNCNGMLKSNSSLGHHSIPVDDRSFQNGRDAEESLRESSPGFDVLVDDQHGDTEYYHNEDQLTRLGGHDGRNLDDFEFRHPDYYNSEADADQDRFHDPQSYNSYDCRQQSYGYEHSRASSERSLREAAHFDRRGLLKAEDRIRESDLRNRLKQRKVGSMRSVISSDYAPTSQVNDQGYQNSRRDIQHSPPLENSHRSRLQGRLRVRRSSLINGHGVYTERETNRGRNWGSLSPSKPQSVPHQGRLRNRLGRRVQDDTPDVKSFTNFAAPKSLAELKVSKQPHGKEQEQHMKPERSIANANGKRKLQDNSQQGESDLSFEGPKLLSEILKRKKRAEASAVENHVESKEQVMKCHFSAPDNKEEHKQAPASVSSVSEQQVHTDNKGENNHVISDVKHRDSDNKSKSTAAGTSEANKPDELEAGDGLIDGEDEYHEEPEGEYEYEEAEGDYEYEEGDVEDYGGENAEGEEDFMEEDDGDDFAKRIGVVPV